MVPMGTKKKAKGSTIGKKRTIRIRGHCPDEKCTKLENYLSTGGGGPGRCPDGKKCTKLDEKCPDEKCPDDIFSRERKANLL